jgi:hypothetical protein
MQITMNIGRKRNEMCVTVSRAHAQYESPDVVTASTKTSLGCAAVISPNNTLELPQHVTNTLELPQHVTNTLGLPQHVTNTLELPQLVTNPRTATSRQISFVTFFAYN